MWGTGYVLKGRWSLQEQIAHGSYSTVWRASDCNTGQIVAVKNLRVGRDLESAKRALREVEMLKHFIDSENILQLIDVVVIPGIQTPVEEICIISELMDYDLHALISPSAPLEPGQLKLIMHQILCGVYIMHSAHTLHRDLKPKNILVNSDLTTKICDLGMGRGKMNNGSSLKMTMISRVATASYRAPDGILNISCNTSTDTESDNAATVKIDVQPASVDEVSNYTKAVDVWACGCIMAEMITGSPLFPYKDNSALLSAFVDLLGCPPESLLDRIPQSSALTKLEQIMKEKASHKPRLPDLFPQTDSAEALDLCLKLLNFDPVARITIPDALNHEYFDEYDEVDVPDIPRFQDPTDNPDLTLSDCNSLIIAAIDNIPQLAVPLE